MEKDTAQAKSLLQKTELAVGYLQRTATIIAGLRRMAAGCDPAATEMPADNLPQVIDNAIAGIRSALDTLRTTVDRISVRLGKISAENSGDQFSIRGEGADPYGDIYHLPDFCRTPFLPLDRTSPIVTNACGDDYEEICPVTFYDRSFNCIGHLSGEEPGVKTIPPEDFPDNAALFIVSNNNAIEPHPYYTHCTSAEQRQGAAVAALDPAKSPALASLRRYVAAIHGDDLDRMDERAYGILASWNPATTSMFRMFQDDKSLSYFPAVDLSNVTYMAAAFQNCTNLTHTAAAYDTSKVTNFAWAFAYCNNLYAVPLIDTSSATDLSWLFSRCQRITSVPPLDTAKATTMEETFSFCNRLESVQLSDTPDVRVFKGTFYNCYALKNVSGINMSKAVIVEQMYYNCYALTSIPPVNAPKAQSLRYFVRRCDSLTELPDIDAPLATDCEGMAMECAALQRAGAVNIPAATNLSYLFHGCRALTEVASVTTSKATTMRQMFYQCKSMTHAPELDAASATDLTFIISGCLALTHLTIRNLGRAAGLTSAPFTGVQKWGSGSDEARQTLVDTLLTYSFDRAAAGYDVCRISVAAAVLARLTEAEIAAITAKGFTITA